MKNNQYQERTSVYRQSIDFKAFIAEREKKKQEGCFFNMDIFEHLKYPFDLQELSLLEGINQVVPIEKRSATIWQNLLGKAFYTKTSSRWYDADDLLETQPDAHSSDGYLPQTKVRQNIDNTFWHVIEYVSSFQYLEVGAIQKIHSLLFQNDIIRSDFRNRPASIQGTYYQPLKNAREIERAMEEMCHLINLHQDPYSKSLLVTLLLSYIQPFEDGNKRVATILSNAMLITSQKIPILYEAVDLNAFRKAVLVFYERNNILLAKHVMVESYLRSSHQLRMIVL